GWRRLRERGRFVQPESGRRLVEDMEDLASPIGAFVRERCCVAPGRECAVEDLFAAWGVWCEDNGRREHGTVQTFGRDLLAALPGISRRQPRVEGGGRERVYVGIDLAGS